MPTLNVLNLELDLAERQGLVLVQVAQGQLQNAAVQSIVGVL